MHAYSLTARRASRDGKRAARVRMPRGCAAHAVHAWRSNDLSGGAMVRRAYQQRRLVEVLLPDADKLRDPTLRRGVLIGLGAPNLDCEPESGEDYNQNEGAFGACRLPLG